MITVDALGFVYVDGNKICRIDRGAEVIQFRNQSRIKEPGREFIDLPVGDFLRFLRAPQEYANQPRPIRRPVVG